MFRAFNLIECKWDGISKEPGEALLKNQKEQIKRSLEPYLNNGIVDGTKLTDHWFPTVKADVFISHSHKDEESAMKLAGWLKNNLDLEPFIDSAVWGNAPDLLKIIDDKFCKRVNPDGSENYDYDKRNGSTSHVHMMLSSALSRMLDETECVIFIKTDNSITSEKAVAKTQSPWLFHELATMRIMRRKQPLRKMMITESFSGRIIVKAASMKVEYEVPLSDLTPLNGNQLNRWLQSYNDSGGHALDVLYGIVPEPELDL